MAEESGDRLSEDELVSMILLLLVAGHETTVNLIGNGVLALLENPEQWERLRANPALLPLAVEEFARYYSPVDLANARYTTCDVDIAGSRIPRGQAVLASLASANRDETKFDRPDTLHVGREPNRHVAFGHPKIIETGIDLLNHASLIFFESGYSLHTLRQASRRSWRIGQRQSVRVFLPAL